MKLLNLIKISIFAFLIKHIIQATIEFTDLIPVRPKAYIWGKWDRAQITFFWQFIYTFWMYILFALLLYFILSKTIIRKVETGKVILGLLAVTLITIFLIHLNQFPYKEMLSEIEPKRFNYEIIEDIIIYGTLCFVYIFLIRIWVIDK